MKKLFVKNQKGWKNVKSEQFGIDMLNYKISIKIIKKLLDNNLITLKEYEEIDQLNKKSFNLALYNLY